MRFKLREIYLFKDLSDETLDQIEKVHYDCGIIKGQYPFYEGDDSKYLFYLQKEL